LFPFGCHSYIMQRRSPTRCSILITSHVSASAFLPVSLHRSAANSLWALLIRR